MIRLVFFWFFGAGLALDSAFAATSAAPVAKASFPASKVKAVRVTGADWQVSFQARRTKQRRNKPSRGESYLFEIKSGEDSPYPIEELLSLSADGTVIVQENHPLDRLRNKAAGGTPEEEEEEKDGKQADPSAKALPKARLKVTGPGEAALSLFLLRGKTRIVGWRGPVFISSLENTEVSGERNQGAWRLNLRRGKVNLQKHKGELDGQGFHLKTVLKEQQGSVRLQFNEGRLQISESKGDLNWTTDRGEASLRSFEGGLKGESVSGKISGKDLRLETARLFSKKGAVILHFASRPLLDIKSASGVIHAPRYMNKKQSGKALAVSGRLRGAGPRKGEVFIETESGTVFVR